MSRFIASLDQGTTSTRLLVFDHAGAIVAQARRDHAQIYPRPGWVEHDALELWRNSQAVITEALAVASLNADALAAIGITNQRETTVIWDRRTGEPCTTRWCGRTRESTRWLPYYRREAAQDRFRASTGLPLASYFSGLKLKWLLDQRARRAGARRCRARAVRHVDSAGCSGISPAARTAAGTSPM